MPFSSDSLNTFWHIRKLCTSYIHTVIVAKKGFVLLNPDSSVSCERSR